MSDRLHGGRPCREVKRVRRTLPGRSQRSDFVVFEYLDKLAPVAGSMPAGDYDALPAAPAGSTAVPKPGRVTRAQAIADAAEAVLRDQGAPWLRWGDVRLLAMIAQRVGLGADRKPHHNARRIISSLTLEPGRLLADKVRGNNGRTVKRFRLRN